MDTWCLEQTCSAPFILKKYQSISEANSSLEPAGLLRCLLHHSGYLCSHSCAILTGLLAAWTQLPSGHWEIYDSGQTIYIQCFICDFVCAHLCTLTPRGSILGCGNCRSVYFARGHVKLSHSLWPPEPHRTRVCPFICNKSSTFVSPNNKYNLYKQLLTILYVILHCVPVQW